MKQIYFSQSKFKKIIIKRNIIFHFKLKTNPVNFYINQEELQIEIKKIK